MNGIQAKDDIDKGFYVGFYYVSLELYKYTGTIKAAESHGGV